MYSRHLCKFAIRSCNGTGSPVPPSEGREREKTCLPRIYIHPGTVEASIRLSSSEISELMSARSVGTLPPPPSLFALQTVSGLPRVGNDKGPREIRVLLPRPGQGFQLPSNSRRRPFNFSSFPTIRSLTFTTLPRARFLLPSSPFIALMLHLVPPVLLDALYSFSYKNLRAEHRARLSPVPRPQ